MQQSKFLFTFFSSSGNELKLIKSIIPFDYLTLFAKSIKMKMWILNMDTFYTKWNKIYLIPNLCRISRLNIKGYYSNICFDIAEFSGIIVSQHVSLNEN
jgi:hypothetical protein